MAKNYIIMRNQKLKSVGAVKNVLAEQMPSELDEKRKSPRADSSRTHQNTNSGTLEEAFDTYLELLPEKRRKNAVIGAMQLISTSEEFETEEEEEEFYKKAREFVEKNFGKIVGWSIHRDETSTHMQCVTIPLVDGKLNARKLFGGNKHKMEQLQTDFYNEVGKQFGLARGEPKAKTKAIHKTVEEFHREKILELQEQKNKLQKNENILKQRIDYNIRVQQTVEKMISKKELTENSNPKRLYSALESSLEVNLKLKTENENLKKENQKLLELKVDELAHLMNQKGEVKAETLGELLTLTQEISSIAQEQKKEVRGKSRR